jgi:hypothetical protein
VEMALKLPIEDFIESLEGYYDELNTFEVFLRKLSLDNRSQLPNFLEKLTSAYTNVRNAYDMYGSTEDMSETSVGLAGLMSSLVNEINTKYPSNEATKKATAIAAKLKEIVEEARQAVEKAQQEAIEASQRLGAMKEVLNKAKTSNGLLIDVPEQMSEPIAEIIKPGDGIVEQAEQSAKKAKEKAKEAFDLFQEIQAVIRQGKYHGGTTPPDPDTTTPPDPDTTPQDPDTTTPDSSHIMTEIDVNNEKIVQEVNSIKNKLNKAVVDVKSANTVVFKYLSDVEQIAKDTISAVEQVLKTLKDIDRLHKEIPLLVMETEIQILTDKRLSEELNAIITDIINLHVENVTVDYTPPVLTFHNTGLDENDNKMLQSLEKIKDNTELEDIKKRISNKCNSTTQHMDNIIQMQITTLKKLSNLIVESFTREATDVFGLDTATANIEQINNITTALDNVNTKSIVSIHNLDNAIYKANDFMNKRRIEFRKDNIETIDPILNTISKLKDTAIGMKHMLQNLDDKFSDRVELTNEVITEIDKLTDTTIEPNIPNNLEEITDLKEVKDLIPKLKDLESTVTIAMQKIEEDKNKILTIKSEYETKSKEVESIITDVNAFRTAVESFQHILQDDYPTEDDKKDNNQKDVEERIKHILSKIDIFDTNISTLEVINMKLSDLTEKTSELQTIKNDINALVRMASDIFYKLPTLVLKIPEPIGDKTIFRGGNIVYDKSYTVEFVFKQLREFIKLNFGVSIYPNPRIYKYFDSILTDTNGKVTTSKESLGKYFTQFGSDLIFQPHDKEADKVSKTGLLTKIKQILPPIENPKSDFKTFDILYLPFPEDVFYECLSKKQANIYPSYENKMHVNLYSATFKNLAGYHTDGENRERIESNGGSIINIFTPSKDDAGNVLPDLCDIHYIPNNERQTVLDLFTDGLGISTHQNGKIRHSSKKINISKESNLQALLMYVDYVLFGIGRNNFGDFSIITNGQIPRRSYQKYETLYGNLRNINKQGGGYSSDDDEDAFI